MIVAAHVIHGDGFLKPELFPGRWNSRRAIPADVEPGASAVACALQQAGWWTPGSGQDVSGGLVLASDGASLEPLRRFAHELEVRPDGAIGPADFLFSLPSTAAAVLGLLFGLREYQSTGVGGEEVLVQTLGHGLDLLALGRVRRLCFVALSVREARRQAVAWCLDGENPAALASVEVEVARPSPGSFSSTTCDHTISTPMPAADAFARATAWLASNPPHGARQDLVCPGGRIILQSQGRNQSP